MIGSELSGKKYEWAINDDKRRDTERIQGDQKLMVTGDTEILYINQKYLSILSQLR